MSAYFDRVQGEPAFRRLLLAAKEWQIPPTVVLRWRTINTREYTDQDISLLLALEDYLASLCPGCKQPLSETTKDEHADAYRPDPPIKCHYCAAQALTADVVGKAEERGEPVAGLLHSFHVDPDIVELNLMPVPPLPPELVG